MKELRSRAFSRFGKGRHPGGLSYGHRCSCALATVRGEALLYKGASFGQTDLTPVDLPTSD